MKNDHGSVKVSVIVPIYNVEAYLPQCLDSLLGQSLREIEIVCVNDGSPDGSQRVLERYAKRDSRIVVISQKNGGAASARNRGLDAAHGKYVSFVDPDDWCDLDMMRGLYETAERNHAEMTVCGFKKYDDDIGQVVEEKIYPKGIVNRSQPFSASSIAETAFMWFEHVPWNKFINREYLNRLGVRFQHLSRAEDLSFVETCMACADRIAIANSPYYYYRVRSGSSQKTNDKSPLVFCEGYLELKNQLVKRGKWKTFKTCFRRTVLASMIYTLKSLSNAASFEQAYREIRERWFGCFELGELRRTDWINPGEQWEYLEIIKNDASPLRFMLRAFHAMESSSQKLSAALQEAKLQSAADAKSASDSLSLQQRMQRVQRENAMLVGSQRPVVSVIVPVHNGKDTVATAVNSVLEQTLRQVEVICVDDGSDDGTLAVLKGLAERDARVKVLQQRKTGVSAARNAGLDAATGKYIAFLDADDEYVMTCLWNAVSKAESDNCDVVQVAHCEVSDGQVVRTYPPHVKCTALDVRACPQIVQFQTKYVWDKLYRREMIEKNHIRFAPYGYHEDHLFLFRVDLVAKNFASVPEVGYRYCKSSAGAATRAYDERLLDCPKAYADICDLARRAGLFPLLAKSIWVNCSMSYAWRVWNFPKYDNNELQSKIVDGWYHFFQANFPRWQKNMHLQGYPVVLPPKHVKKVLLLGGTGALGSHLKDILASQGWDVYVTTRRDFEDAGNIHYLKGDALDMGFFRKLMQSRWDAIVDFMVYGPIGFSQRLNTFLEMTQQYVFLSSSRVYADSKGEPIVESSPRLLDVVGDEEYLKTSEYALSKARAENMLQESGKRNWTVIRPYITFSEERLQLGTLEKEQWLKRVIDGRPIVFSEDVAEKTTVLTYGRDVARGMAAVIGRKEALGECFHITCNRRILWKDVLALYVRVIEDVTGRKCPVVMTKNSCQLKTPGKYQVIYDRLFNRNFSNAKIGKFIDVSSFSDPVIMLERCLRTFLRNPEFLKVNDGLDRLHDEACGVGMAPRLMYTVERNVQILIAALKAHGIDQIIASPGTTNLTFVASLQHDPFFKIRSAPDERSAAYMACGMAAESGRPVVITCTGATASRNYLPGLTEAFYRKLPVLAVTGTLYESRTGHLVPQFIDRSSAPDDTYVLKESMPCVRSPDEEWSDILSANRAILELTRHGGGPVHINLETKENPDFSCQKLPGIRVIKRHFLGEPLPEIPAGKVAVLVGSHGHWSDELTAAVDAFCERYDAPVFCSHTSNYRGKHAAKFTLACYQQSGSCVNYRPETLIHIGDVFGDYPSMKLCGAAKVWRVSRDGEIRDLFKRLFHVFEMDESTFFRHYAGVGAKRDYGYRASCVRHLKDLQGRLPTLPFSNIWMASQSSLKIPSGAFVHFGILNSFRSWSLFMIPPSVETSCNTGGFGIDGCVSTVLGASFANPERLHYVVLGDLAFFYDMNVLGNRHFGPNVRILLVNNGKGVEFRNFNHPAYQFGDDADRFVAAAGHYGNKSPRLVKDYAEDLGFDYITASSKEEYLKKAAMFWNPMPLKHPVVFEVFTDNVDESDALERMTLIEGAAPEAVRQPAAGCGSKVTQVSAARDSAGKSAVAPVNPATATHVPDLVQKAHYPKVSPRKIAILTFHAAYNCGALLQGWALQTVLRRLGFEPEFPDCTKIGFFSRFGEMWYKPRPNVKDGFWRRLSVKWRTEIGAIGIEDAKRHRFRMFAKRCLAIRPVGFDEVDSRYSAVIVGSDQVWNHKITLEETKYFRATMFKNPALKRYSYALSVGDAAPEPASVPYLAAAARNFENLSFRENLLPQLVDRHGNHPTVDPDPTLLLTKDDFNRIAYPKRLVRKPYLVVYALVYNEKTWAAAREMAKRLKLKPVFIQVYQYGKYRIADPEGVHLAVSPDRFLAYIRDAEVVITSSFHGTAFSIIYGKRFATLPYVRGKVTLRCSKLLKSLHEEIHQIDDPTDFNRIAEALKHTPKPETEKALRRLAAQTIGRLGKTLPDLSVAPPSPPRPRHHAVTWPFRKVWGGVKCLSDNGIGYTMKHVVGKAFRAAGVRVRW